MIAFDTVPNQPPYCFRPFQNYNIHSVKKGIIILVSSTIILGSIGLLIYFSKGNFRKNLVKTARRELERWKGYKELSPAMSETLVRYWKSVGRVFTVSQMQSPAIQDTYPWSSAFISYVFFKAGAKEKFPYSSGHAGYFQVAKQNRNNPSAPLRGFRINEYAPKIGDLIVFSRQQGAGYDTPGFFPAHGELIVETGQGYVKTIGGNVADRVTESRFTTDQKGFITRKERDFFMVIQNRI